MIKLNESILCILTRPSSIFLESLQDMSIKLQMTINVRKESY